MRPISTPYGTDQRPAELEADLPQPPMTAELPAEPVIPIYELPTHYDMYEKYYSPSITSSRTRASSLYSSNHIGRSGTGNYRHIVATSKLLPPPPLREAPSPPRSYGGSIGGSGNCHRWTERPAIDEDEASERASLMSRASRERRVQRFGIGGAGNSVRRNAIMRRARSTSSCSSTNVPSEDGSIIHNHGMGTDSERTSQYSKESLDSGADKLLGRLMRPIRRRKVEIIE